MTGFTKLEKAELAFEAMVCDADNEDLNNIVSWFIELDLTAMKKVLSNPAISFLISTVFSEVDCDCEDDLKESFNITDSQIKNLKKVDLI